MTTFTARAGWHWVMQGMQLFGKQPGGLMALFFCCMFLALLLMIVPLVGQVAPFVLTPLFTVALLEGCAQVDQGKRALPNLLLSGFRQPVRSPLLLLGAVNFLLLLIAMAVLYGMAGDVLLQFKGSKPELTAEQVNSVVGAGLLASAIYTIGWLLTCLAAPLVYWQKLTVGKALFFSVVSVTRAFKPFFVAAVTLHVIYFLCCQLVMLIFGTSQVTMAGISALILITIVIAHCTLYISYQEIFVRNQVPPEKEAAPSDDDGAPPPIN